MVESPNTDLKVPGSNPVCTEIKVGAVVKHTMDTNTGLTTSNKF